MTEANGDKALMSPILMLSRHIIVVRRTCGEQRAGPESNMRNSRGLPHSAEGDVAGGKAVLSRTHRLLSPPLTQVAMGWRQSSMCASYHI